MKKIIVGCIIIGGVLAFRMNTRADFVRPEIPMEVAQDALFNDILNPQEFAEAIAKYREFINDLNQLGVTPLMSAVKVARLDHVKLLLENGANPNVRSADPLRGSDMPIDKGGNTAGHFALYYGNNGIIAKDVASAISAGATDIQPSVVEGIVVGLIDHEANFSIRNNAQDQPIHYLEEIQSNEVKMRLVTFLMTHDVDIYTQGYKGDTMLHQAVEKNDIAWIELLYKLIGSDIKRYTVKNNDGLTPLELARKRLNTDVEEVLLNIEAEIKAKERAP